MQDLYNQMERIGNWQDFNSWVNEDASLIDCITVDTSFINVNFIASNKEEENEIKINLCGKAMISCGEASMEIQLVEQELHIKVNPTGNIRKSSLRLDIFVPSSKVFRLISVKTLYNVSLSDKINTNNLKIETSFGKICSSASFSKASFNDLESDIELFINPENDIVVDISSSFGSVFLHLDNIAHVNLQGSSFRDRITNSYTDKPFGYIADITYRLTSGFLAIE